MPELFHFQHPEWFWLTLPLLLMLWLLYRVREPDSAWRRVCDERLLPYLLDAHGTGRKRLPFLLLLSGGLLAIIALADPVWEQREQPVFRNEAARVIVLDLSSSMASTDLKPSRMVQARYKVSDILREYPDGQTGLVVFAGDAFTVSPLTHDTDTIEALLEPLSPTLMPVQGSRVDRGLQQAADLLRQAGLPRGEILLVTDGMQGREAINTADELAAAGYRTSVLAVGTDAGAPIPTGRGGFLRDAAGEIVIPALDQDALRALADAGRGGYAVIRSDSLDIRGLVADVDTQTGAQDGLEGLTTDDWVSTGPLLAALLLPLAALAFRRGWLLVTVLAVGVGVSTPQPALAFSWDDVWLRPDQQASRALEGGDAAQAAQLAEDPGLRGTAAYRAGDFEAALSSFGDQASADADYNRGNALAQLQRYEEAIAAYDRALEQQPGMEDALHNRAEIERLLQQQEQQQQQQQQQDQQQSQDSQQGQGDSESEPASGDESQAGEGETANEGESGEQAAGEAGAEPGDAAAADQQDGDSESATSGPSEGDETMQGQADASGQDEQDAASQQADMSPDEEEQAGTEPMPGEQGGAEQDGAMASADAAEPLDEEARRAAEQWLRRIPDDPAGLLRRKFLYQYNQRATQDSMGGSQSW